MISMSFRRLPFLFLFSAMFLSFLLLDSACGYSWDWISGSSYTDKSGDYGTITVASATNVPGARGSGGRWIGKNGDLWLFGGYGNASGSSYGYLNDMWKWNGTVWT